MGQPKIRWPPEIPLIPVKMQQSLSLPIGVLSLHRKNVHNHCCCPISAIILTTSELEAILEICRCSLKLSKRGKGLWGGGGSSPRHLSTCLGCRCAGSLGLHAWWHPFHLLFQCLFLLLHLFLFRGYQCRTKVYTTMMYTKITAVWAMIVGFWFRIYVQFCETILVKMTHEFLNQWKFIKQ